MTFQHVKSTSSQIESYAYHEPSQVLEVKFRTGGTYHYHDFPKDAYHAFHGAESHGKHFHAHIRNCFQTSRIKEAA